MRRAADSTSLRPAATSTSDSRLELVARSGLSMEVGMKHWAESCRVWLAGMAVVAMGLMMIAPSLAATQGSGAGSTEPVASPQTNVTPAMLQQAQQSGDWLMYGQNYWNNRYSPLRQVNTTNVKNLIPR